MTQLKYIENSEHREILTTPTQLIEFPISNTLKSHIKTLLAYHQQCCGVGLAAPQLGIAEKFFLIEITKQQAELRDNATAYTQTIFFNPSYQPIENTTIRTDLEACFSVKQTAGWVPRYHAITFNAQDIDGKAISFIAEGFLARVLQHETDHLSGILIIDRLTKDCTQGTPEAMYTKRRQLLPAKKAAQLDALREKQNRTKDY